MNTTAEKLTNVTITLALPDDLLAYIEECGVLDWGIVEAKTDEEHVADFANTLRLTREHFKQEGAQPLSGLYVSGSDTVMAHTGTSPKAAMRARILAGLWNAMAAQLVIGNPITGDHAVIVAELAKNVMRCRGADPEKPDASALLEAQSHLDVFLATRDHLKSAART